jgi:C4-dicarboxylate-specific signal transduction histidine kinase
MHEARVQLTHVARVMSLGELTASIAHEVNQPLAAIMTSGDASLRWLAAEPANVDRARAALERIVGDASRASAVITRVRSLARRAPPARSRTDLNEAIHEVVALTRSEIDHNAIDLDLVLDPDLPRAYADRIQIQQVILNLVLNAIEAMRAVGGRKRELSIGTHPEGNQGVRVTVRDSGSGLDAAQAERLFDPFFTTKKEGLGIGLTISRSIVEAHGGRIWAEPQATGAAVQFVLPLEAPEPA